MNGDIVTGEVRHHALFNRYFISIWAINLLAFISHTAMNSLCAVYMRHLGISNVFSGYLTLFFAVFAMAARFLCGSLSDRIGRRVLMMLSCLIMGAGVLCFGLVPVLFLMLIFRGLQGFGFSVNDQTISAATADVMPMEKIGLGFGSIWLGQAIATILASTLVSGAIAAGNYRTIFYTMTALMAGGVVLGFFCNYEKKPEYKANRSFSAPDQKGIWRYLEPKALPAAAITVFLGGGMAGVVYFLYYYAIEIGYQTPEIFFYFSAAFMLITNVLTARFSDRLHPLKLMVPCLLCGAVCNLLLSAAIGNPAVLFPVSGVFYGIAIGNGYPKLNQIAVKASPSSRRGAASATFYLAMDVGFGVFAVIWGWALDVVSFRVAFSGAAVCILVSLGLSLFFLGRKEHPLIQSGS
jgi:MFS family permease